MKPTVGRIVHFYTPNWGRQSDNCGVGPYPAVVTHVWSQFCVNLKVLPDGRPPFDMTSVTHEEEMGSSERLHDWWMWPPKE